MTWITDLSEHWLAVHVTSGPHSTPIPAVLDLVDRAVAAGRDDLRFVAADVGAWGLDVGLTPVDLLRAVVEHPAEALYGVDRFEPSSFLEHFEGLLPLLASGRFSWINLPIHSGSQRIVDAMQRRYAIDAVLAAAARLRGAAPDLVLRTDILYGFADETEAEFRSSIEVSRRFDAPSFDRASPSLLPPGVIDARSRAVAAELEARTAGGPVRVRHHRVDRASVAERGDSPNRLDGFEAWRDKTNRVFARMIGRPEGLQIGAGWSVRGSHVDPRLHAVVLEVGHPDGRRFAVALAHPDQSGEYLRVTRRFALWIPSRDGLDGPGAQGALERLERALMG